jgi:hypothetical protein
MRWWAVRFWSWARRRASRAVRSASRRTVGCWRGRNSGPPRTPRGPDRLAGTLGIFLDERCELVADGSTPAKDLYAAYVRWCEETRESILNSTMFGRKLTERGIVKEKAGVVHRMGIRLLSQLSEPSRQRQAAGEFGQFWTVGGHFRELPICARIRKVL